MLARHNKPGRVEVQPIEIYHPDMSEPRLEDVFKTSGVPTYTFVRPTEFTQLLVALRSPGRGVVIEGPSGIGKTTAIENALEEVGISKNVTKLSARKQSDVEYIQALPEISDVGAVVVDDFHKLNNETRSRLADYMKTLADEEVETVKLIILGINRAGENLISFANDLVNRIDIIPFEANPDEKVDSLIGQGEHALNIRLNVRQEIVREAKGSFYLAQMLAREVCMEASVLERRDSQGHSEVSLPAVRSRVWERLGLSFRQRCESFCTGTRLRKEGRAPYLHILNWLATSSEWTLSLRDAVRQHAELRGSVGQVVEKGYLSEIVEGDPQIRAVLHYDKASEQLTVEDPQFLFYIRNIPWRRFANDLGFISVEFENRYDFALSFAGPDRNLARQLFESLQDQEVEVFYDQNEQHRILAEDVEEYLRPIYQTEARFIVVLLGPEYPKRVWTKFESDAFRNRFSEGAVVPVWFADAPPGIFDETTRKGGFNYDPALPMENQVSRLTELLLRKLAEERSQSKQGG